MMLDNSEQCRFLGFFFSCFLNFSLSSLEFKKKKVFLDMIDCICIDLSAFHPDVETFFCKFVFSALSFISNFTELQLSFEKSVN